MNLVRRSWLVVLMTLFVGVGTGVAQSRVQLAQGRRAIQDQVSFVVDISRDKRYGNDPRFADGPEDIRIWVSFLDHPASGRIYVDGKAIGRLDEVQQFNSNPIDVTYGRHTITVTVNTPALLGTMFIDVRGAIVHEILDDAEPSVTLKPDLSKRVTDLERKVQDLEAELATLKKRRNH